MCGVGNGLRDGTEPRVFGSSEGSGIDDALLVVEIFVECQQETGALAVSNRSGDGPFVVLAALGRLHNREGVGSIEDGVTKKKIERSVIGRRAAFGHDFQAGPAGARKARGVRVVVDLYFLHSRGSDARAVGLNAVYHKCDAVGSGGVVVEKTRHGGDVVLIEDGNAVESVAVDGVDILVGGIFCADAGYAVSGSDGYRFVGNRDLHGHANGSRALAG